MAQHGTPYSKRREVLREKILMMKSIWVDEESSFEGELLSLEPSWAWPKPVQKPHPPIIMGADAGPRTIADIVEFCDGWMPLATRMNVVDRAVLVRQALEDAGRDPSSLEITAYGARADSLDLLREAGVDRAVFSVPSTSSEVIIPKLDELAVAAGLT
jgi:alkanesulfonate monooxygenase SsuD/methylene tetrahydromethanopterin reductase-like flavin-dependent oxidoreductase (luciferase family)